VTVYIPAALWNYTKNTAEVELSGSTVREVMAALDTKFPGIRHRIIDEQDRIRTHIKFFVNTDACATIDCPVRASDSVTIVCALSGG
jgi:molybdopterin synthase sulfur carrier subunit